MPRQLPTKLCLSCGEIASSGSCGDPFHSTNYGKHHPGCVCEACFIDWLRAEGILDER